MLFAATQKPLICLRVRGNDGGSQALCLNADPHSPEPLMTPPWLRTRMRKEIAVAAAACLVLAFSALASYAQTPKKDDGFQTAAPHAILIDAESGTVLFEKAADQLVPPASLAKLMTAELVFHLLDTGKIKLDDEFVISENAWRKGGAPSGGSAMFAAIHSRVKVEDLLRGVIIQSGNDACIALAEGIAGNEFAFAEMMTSRAREIGLTRSTFTNSTGLHDAGLNVTARELARLAQHIIRTYPDRYPIYNEREFTWNKIRQQNRNPLLAMSIGADGLKTGYTKEAGYGLVGSALNNGLRLILAVNGFKTAKERAEESRKLLEWGFNSFSKVSIFDDGEVVGRARVWGGRQMYVALASKGPATIDLPKYPANQRLSAEIVYRAPLKPPVRKGDQVATLRISSTSSAQVEIPLYAQEDVEASGLTWRGIDTLVIMALRRLTL